MHIEFFGLPGAGKSTAFRMLNTALQQRGVKIASRDEIRIRHIQNNLLAAYGPKYPFRRPITALYASLIWLEQLYWRACARFFSGVFDKARSLPLYWLVEDSKLLRCWAKSPISHAAFMHSEGFAHHFASSIVWSGSRAATLGNRAPYSIINQSIAIHVSTSQETARKRLESRGRPASWPKGHDLDEVLPTYAHALDQATELLSSNGVPIHVMDFEKSKDELAYDAAKLAETLLPLLGKTRP